MTDIETALGDIEFLYVDVTADRQLDAQSVEVAIAPTLDAVAWRSASWQGTAGTSRSCRVLLDGTLLAGKYNIWVRVTDTPEIPIIKAGTLRVKAN